MTALVEAPSFRKALQVRLARERLLLLRALAAGDDLQAQISSTEIVDLLALAGRSDLDLNPAHRAAG